MSSLWVTGRMEQEESECYLLLGGLEAILVLLRGVSTQMHDLFIVQSTTQDMGIRSYRYNHSTPSLSHLIPTSR